MFYQHKLIQFNPLIYLPALAILEGWREVVAYKRLLFTLALFAESME